MAVAVPLEDTACLHLKMLLRQKGILIAK